MDSDLYPKDTYKPADWQPHFDTWTLQYKSGQRQVVRATFGVSSDEALDHLLDLLKAEHGPDVLERAQLIPLSKAETETPLIFAYWADPAAYEAWNGGAAVRAFFQTNDSADASVARWQETGLISLTHNETNYSHDETLTGLAKLAAAQRTQCDIYSYWGAARDRLPASQSDDMAPYGSADVTAGEGSAERTVIKAPGNFCVIRTSQDWTKAPKDHEDWYLGSVEPTLKAGARFLHQRATSIGAYATRYIHELGDDGEKVGRTCVLGYFQSMAALEDWTHNHPTHTAIYDAGLAMFAQFGTDVGVRLYHEVSVFPQGDFVCEYTNCGPEVGLLRTLAA